MAEGWLRHHLLQHGLDDEVWSAGTEKTLVKPQAQEVMREVGIDIGQHWSKTIAELPEPERFDAVWTVCHLAEANCPFFPAARRYHTSLADPSGQDMERWRQSRDQIGQITQWLAQQLKSGRWPTPHELNSAAAQITEQPSNSP